MPLIAMKVLFLDVDGVLNSHDWWSRRDPNFDQTTVTGEEDCLYDLDPLAVARLEGLIQDTGCHVVVSSSWRMYHTLDFITGLLMKRGISEESARRFIGATPRFYGETRGTEIQAWLDNYQGDVEAYAIVDDDSDMTPEQKEGHFVKTDMAQGLTDKEITLLKGLLK